MNGDSSIKYYYAVGKDRRGPVGMSELQRLARNGELDRSDKVWRKGMDKWTEAGEIAEIYADLPPDLEDVLDASDNSEPNRDPDGRAPSTIRRIFTTTLLMAVIAAIALVSSRLYRQSQLEQLERIRSGIVHNARTGFHGTVVGTFPSQEDAECWRRARADIAAYNDLRKRLKAGTELPEWTAQLERIIYFYDVVHEDIPNEKNWEPTEERVRSALVNFQVVANGLAAGLELEEPYPECGVLGPKYYWRARK